MGNNMTMEERIDKISREHLKPMTQVSLTAARLREMARELLLQAAALEDLTPSPKRKQPTVLIDPRKEISRERLKPMMQASLTAFRLREMAHELKLQAGGLEPLTSSPKRKQPTVLIDPRKINQKKVAR